MSDEEEIDELPPIEVDSFARDASKDSLTDSFEMPAADELASQRERELACEQQLREPAHEEARAPSADPSGSEGEAALAEALRALRVLGAPPAPRAPPAAAAAALLEALLPHLPPAAFLLAYLDACRRLDDHALAAVTDDMLSHISSLVWCADNAWSSAEAECACAWLCVVAVSAAARGARLAAARAARALAGGPAAPAPLAALSRALARAPPAALLPLADALGPAAGGRLAADLRDAALAHLLALPREEVSWSSCAELGAAASRRWPALAGGARYALVQLAGRRLAGACGVQDAAALLRALELAPAPAPALRLHPDHLKVSVGVSKLQLLFGSKN